jgi:phospholipase A-2-activating protein
MPNGDIVSGCSDGIVRVFSESEDRWASAEELKTYADRVASQALPSQTIGDVKKADLPGSESLAEPGSLICRVGESMIINPPFQGKSLARPRW